MRIGRYQLRRVHKRFWFFLAALLLLFALAIFFWPSSPSPQQEWQDGQQTAFSDIGLSSVQSLRDPTLKKEDIFADERLANCTEKNPRCIYSVQDPEELASVLGPDALGVPFRFRAYLPSEEAIADGSELPLISERGSLFSDNFSDGNWSFRPAVLLDFLNLQESLAEVGGIDPIGLDTSAAGALSLTDDGIISPGSMLLGFQGGPPASGAIYDIDAMLFSSSNAIQVPGTPAYASTPIPTLLVSDFRRVSGEEVVEPATEVADLDISYAAGSTYQLTLHNFEWPADGKARMCVTLANRSAGIAPLWNGLYEGVRIRIGGVTLLGVPAPGSAFEVGATTEEMQSGEFLSGYLVFGLEQEDPTVGNVSGSPADQAVRLSIASLLQAEPSPSGSLQSQEVFVDISDGEGGGIPFDPVRRSQRDWVPPLAQGETCSE